MASRWRYDVFPNSRGPDVRRGFLSHLRYDFAKKGITMFNDEKMDKGGPSLPRSLYQAIRESRVLVVLLSKNYASSIWCLDELVEILECRKNEVQTVIPIFYHVDPSDVRNQSGDFGSAFMKTCEGKTVEDKQRWSKALYKVANIPGEHIQERDDEAEMIQKIATNVSKKLIEVIQKIDTDVSKKQIDTPSMDFDDVLANETVSPYRLFSISMRARVFKGKRMIDQRIVKEKVTVLSWQTEQQKIAFVLDDEAEMIQKIATVRDYDEICDLLANETVSSYKKGRFSVSKRIFKGMRMIDQRIVKEKVIVLSLQR